MRGCHCIPGPVTVQIEQDSVPPSPILAALIWVSRFIPKWKFIPSTDIPQYGFRVDEKKQLVSAHSRPVGDLDTVGLGEVYAESRVPRSL